MEEVAKEVQEEEEDVGSGAGRVPDARYAAIAGGEEASSAWGGAREAAAGGEEAAEGGASAVVGGGPPSSLDGRWYDALVKEVRESACAREREGHGMRASSRSVGL